MITEIRILNHGHNGDVFIAKGFMQDLIRQLPHIKFKAVNSITPKLLLDLDLEPFHFQIMDGGVKYGITDTSLIISTWVGAYDSIRLADSTLLGSPNWINLRRIWMEIYDNIEKFLGVTLSRNSDPLAYVPTTNWSRYNIAPADAFVQDKKRIALFCNGPVYSHQSGVGQMEDVISALAASIPDMTFVCTFKFAHDPRLTNIYFTDDIFAGTPYGDLNEIAYLSTHAELVVGKNSGPYIFAHVRDNIVRNNVTFISFSHLPEVSLPFGIDKGMNWNYYHSIKESPAEIYNDITSVLAQNNKKMIII